MTIDQYIRMRKLALNLMKHIMLNSDNKIYTMFYDESYRHARNIYKYASQTLREQ